MNYKIIISILFSLILFGCDQYVDKDLNENNFDIKRKI